MIETLQLLIIVALGIGAYIEFTGSPVNEFDFI
jgi:hypothetical protein